MMAFAFIGLMRIMASPEKTVVARPASASPRSRPCTRNGFLKLGKMRDLELRQNVMAVTS
jgi:hypothetical protein